MVHFYVMSMYYSTYTKRCSYEGPLKYSVTLFSILVSPHVAFSDTGMDLDIPRPRVIWRFLSSKKYKCFQVLKSCSKRKNYCFKRVKKCHVIPSLSPCIIWWDCHDPGPAIYLEWDVLFEWPIIQTPLHNYIYQECQKIE